MAERYISTDELSGTLGGAIQPSRLARSLATRFANFFTKPSVPAGIAPVPENTTATGMADINYATFSFSLGTLSFNRRNMWRDLHEMDQNDEIVSRGLDVIADCTVGYEPSDEDGFGWKLEKKNDKAQKILDELRKRLQLGSEVWHIARNFTKWGDEFREVVVDSDGLVQRFKYLPSYQVWPNMDERGNKIPGFEQRVDGARPGSGISFFEWQIIDFIFGPKQGYFGTGLMIPSRRTWRRLQKLEDGMVLARTIRGYDKIVHRIPVKENWSLKQQDEAIRAYKNNMLRKKIMAADGTLYFADSPLTTETDFFIPDDGTKRGGVDIIVSQNHQLQNIEDIRYHRERLLTAIKVPRHYMNLGTGMQGALSAGGTSLEDIQFARTLRQNQATLRRGILELASLQLFLEGMDSDDIGVVVDLPQISTEDFLHTSLTRLNMAKAAQVFSQILGGMDVNILATQYMQLKDKDKDILIKFVKQIEADRKKQEADAMAAQKKAMQAGGNGVAPNGTRAAQPLPKTPFNRSLNSPNGTSPDATGRTVLGGLKVQDLSEALTNLVMLGQAAVEATSNDRYAIGRSERQSLVNNALLESLVDD